MWNSLKLFVCWFFLSLWRIFIRHCQWRVANLDLCWHLWPLQSEGSLKCHTYCVTEHKFKYWSHAPSLLQCHTYYSGSWYCLLLFCCILESLCCSARDLSQYNCITFIFELVYFSGHPALWLFPLQFRPIEIDHSNMYHV